MSKKRISESSVDFEKAFKSKYFERAYLLDDMRKVLGVRKVDWSDMTRVNLTKIVDYLKATHAPNSAKTLASTIKAFLNLYSEDVDIPCKSYRKVLRVKAVPSQHVALTEEELRRLEAYEPKTDAERDVKNLAMREALCGARGVDCEALTMNNVVDGNIVYVSKKTKVETNVPLHHLLSKYLSAPISRKYQRYSINRTLQNMCRKAGIDTPCTVFVGGKTVTKPKWQLMGMHCMRRTFCSILAYLNVPLTVIKQFAGHTNESMTQRYIVNDPTVRNEAAMAFFKGRRAK